MATEFFETNSVAASIICYNRDIERRLLKTVDKVNGACHFDTLVSKWQMRSFLTIKKEQKMS